MTDIELKAKIDEFIYENISGEILAAKTNEILKDLVDYVNDSASIQSLEWNPVSGVLGLSSSVTTADIKAFVLDLLPDFDPQYLVLNESTGELEINDWGNPINIRDYVLSILPAIAVDGITITGDGSPGNPLTAAASSGPPAIGMGSQTFNINFDGTSGSGQVGALIIPLVALPAGCFIAEVYIDTNGGSLISVDDTAYITMGINVDDETSALDDSTGLVETLNANGVNKIINPSLSKASVNRTLVADVGGSDIISGSIRVIIITSDAMVASSNDTKYRTVLEMQAMSVAESFEPGQLYCITDAPQCPDGLNIRALDQSVLEAMGSGKYRNDAMVSMSSSAITASLWYDLNSNLIKRVYEPLANNDVKGSIYAHFSDFDFTNWSNNKVDRLLLTGRSHSDGAVIINSDIEDVEIVFGAATETYNIAGVNTGLKRFNLGYLGYGNYAHILPGMILTLTGSTGNDGVYTIDTSDGAGMVTVLETVASAVADGIASINMLNSANLTLDRVVWKGGVGGSDLVLNGDSIDIVNCIIKGSFLTNVGNATTIQNSELSDATINFNEWASTTITNSYMMKGTTITIGDNGILIESLRMLNGSVLTLPASVTIQSVTIGNLSSVDTSFNLMGILIGDLKTLVPLSNCTDKFWVGDQSTFEETLDITGLTSIDLTGLEYCGIINLISTNAAETINSITGGSDGQKFKFVARANVGPLNITFSGQPKTTVSPTKFLMSSASVVLNDQIYSTFGLGDWIEFRLINNGIFIQIDVRTYL